MIHFFSLVLAIFNLVLRGYLISTFWSWFVLTQFAGLPTLAVLPAIGLSFLVQMFHQLKTLTVKEFNEIKANPDTDGLIGLYSNVGHLIAHLFTWGFAAIVYWLM